MLTEPELRDLGVEITSSDLVEIQTVMGFCFVNVSKADGLQRRWHFRKSLESEKYEPLRVWSLSNAERRIIVKQMDEAGITRGLICNFLGVASTVVAYDLKVSRQ